MEARLERGSFTEKSITRPLVLKLDCCKMRIFVRSLKNNPSYFLKNK